GGPALRSHAAAPELPGAAPTNKTPTTSGEGQIWAPPPPPNKTPTSTRPRRDIYLGHGSKAVKILEADLPNLAKDSRAFTIHSARLATAYAQAGDPHQACLHASTVLETAPRIGSATAVTELRRAIPFLHRWSTNSTVADVIHHITTLT